ncbi:MAG TPA: helix-turn-helix domain-containing protein [Candidatus Thermoplasmatota archaeon]|nr:helix-turn-helix domain-containing protein [Candidatus Thermoplasmatota archaeon]
MSSADPREELFAVVRVGTARLALPEPPIRMRLRFLPTSRGWTLFVHLDHATASVLPELDAWLRDVGVQASLKVHAPGRVVHGDVAGLPKPLDELLRQFQVQHIALEPGAPALVQLAGQREEVFAFAASASAEVSSVRADPAFPPGTGAKDLLTPRQQVALARAVEAGYYEIPRRITLRQLAARQSTSPAALSELLRRAEARVIETHAREMMAVVRDVKPRERVAGDEPRANDPDPRGRRVAAPAEAQDPAK